ncbi:MAG: CoB--CoM heterodisulfide reductase subunit B [Thermoplasmata archaeon]|nr:MAG: CoB--CoM heterodisulfide reductase subunit B [Thermoplasmata archaeon]
MVNYTFFPGCVAPLRYPGIESAARAVLSALDVQFSDLKDVSCCPAPGVFRSFDQQTWLAISARNLALAEVQNADIITICNGCFASLFEVAYILNNDREKLDEINAILADIDLEYNCTTNVKHFADILFKDIGVKKIADSVNYPYKNLKIAVHYGCHFLKPSNVKNIDDPERPMILDKLVEAVGATSVDYMDKNRCCGAGGGVRARAKEVALKMTADKLENIEKAGANCIVDICPFCHLQFDMGAMELGKTNIPVVNLAQLYGLAFGIDKSKLGLDIQAVPIKLDKG